MSSISKCLIYDTINPVDSDNYEAFVNIPAVYAETYRQAIAEYEKNPENVGVLRLKNCPMPGQEDSTYYTHSLWWHREMKRDLGDFWRIHRPLIAANPDYIAYWKKHEL